MDKTFYLAGSYAKRIEYQSIAADIERQSGWRCNARWLNGAHDSEPMQKCAEDDVEDVKNADALVLVNGKSTRGGMWVELGMALAWEKPVVFLVDAKNKGLHICVRPEPPVFTWLPHIEWQPSIGGVCQILKEISER